MERCPCPLWEGKHSVTGPQWQQRRHQQQRQQRQQQHDRNNDSSAVLVGYKINRTICSGNRHWSGRNWNGGFKSYTDQVLTTSQVWIPTGVPTTESRCGHHGGNRLDVLFRYETKAVGDSSSDTSSSSSSNRSTSSSNSSSSSGSKEY